MRAIPTVFCAIVIFCGTCRCQYVAPPISTTASAPIRQAQLNELLNARPSETTLHADDIISISIYGLKDYAVSQRIFTDGTLSLPFIGQVSLSGLTVQAAQSLISNKLATSGMMSNAQVSIAILAEPWATVTVSGVVGKPGVYPVVSSQKLMDYISEAGGIETRTQQNTPVNSPASSIITLIRPTFAAPVTLDLGADPGNSPYARISILAGDEIRVAQAGLIYAIGAVKLQGAFPLKSSIPTTVSELVALAGGTGYEADRSRASVVRMVGGSRQVLPVDIVKIMHGTTVDVALQPEDILYVPSSNLRAAIKGGGAALIVSLATAYLYRN